jgi:hypothetical protein
VSDGELDEVYQDDELPCSFNINLDLALNSLVSDANNVTLSEQKKQTLRNTKKRKILNILYILYYVTYILYYVLYISYYVFDEYSLVLVLNRVSKRLKSVTKKLFGGKRSNRALSTNTLFQGCSTAGTRWAEMMRHMDPSLVGSSTRSQRDEVTFSFSYYISNMKLLTSIHLIFAEGEQLAAGGGGGGHLSQQRTGLWGGGGGGHYEGEAMHYEDEAVWVTDLPQDPHPHANTGLATSFALM